MNAIIEQIRQKRAESNAASVDAVKAAIETVWRAVRTTRALTSDQLAELEKAMELTGTTPGHLLLFGEVDKVVKDATAAISGTTVGELEQAAGRARIALDETEARHERELAEARAKLNNAEGAARTHRLNTERLERMRQSLPAWCDGNLYASARMKFGHDLTVLINEHGITKPNGSAFPLPLPAGGAPAAQASEPGAAVSETETASKPEAQPVEVIAGDQAEASDANERPKGRRKAAAG